MQSRMWVWKIKSAMNMMKIKGDVHEETGSTSCGDRPLRVMTRTVNLADQIVPAKCPRET